MYPVTSTRATMVTSTAESSDPIDPIHLNCRFCFRSGFFVTFQAGILGLAIYMGACEKSEIKAKHEPIEELWI
jgi:hypothetical protein